MYRVLDVRKQMVYSIYLNLADVGYYMLHTTVLFRKAYIKNRLPYSSGAFVLLAKALD